MLWIRKSGLCFAVAAMLLSPACASRRQSPVDQKMARKDINAVLNENDEKIMAIPGVVGIYVGLMPDEKTPCLKVMVVKTTDDLKNRIPKSLEGYPVLLEESGVIRPLAK